MKTSMMLKLAIGLGVFGAMACRADDWFKLSWHGTVYYTSASGQVVSRSFTEKDFIKNVADNNGLDPKTLVFVYRPNSHDTVVVQPSTGWFADIIQMEYEHVDVMNSTQTKVVRQAFLFDEHRGRIGSAFGTETARFDANGALVSDSFHGSFSYAMSDNDPYSDLPSWLEGISPPFVFSGSFSSSARVKDTSGH